MVSRRRTGHDRIGGLFGTALVGLATVAVVVACGTPRQAAQLQQFGNNVVSGTVPRLRPDRPYVFQIRPICTTGTSVKVTGVTVRGAKGRLRLVDWGIHPARPGQRIDISADDGRPGTVLALQGFNHAPVTMPCSGWRPPDVADQLWVSLEFSGRCGSMTGLSVHDGNGRSTPLEFRLRLCGKRNAA